MKKRAISLLIVLVLLVGVLPLGALAAGEIPSLEYTGDTLGVFLESLDNPHGLYMPKEGSSVTLTSDGERVHIILYTNNIGRKPVQFINLENLPITMFLILI